MRTIATVIATHDINNDPRVLYGGDVWMNRRNYYGFDVQAQVCVDNVPEIRGAMLAFIKVLFLFCAL